MKKKSTKKPYQMRQNKLNKIIAELIEQSGCEEDLDLLRELLVTSMKIGKDGLERGDIRLINTCLKELRYSFKVFQEYMPVRKVAVFGSARTKKNDPEYKLAKQFSKKIVKEGWMVITGAASGIMQAGNEGAGRENSFGVNIRLPFEQDANPWIKGDPKLINYKYFFTRKLMFLAQSDATVLCPGGFGTHDEGFETLTLVQTGKTPNRPIVCLDAPKSRYWSEWRRYLKNQLFGRKMVDERDLNLIHFTHDVDEAVDYIRQYYRVYHSQRYIRDLLVFRLKRPLSERTLNKINVKFADILKKGKFKQQRKPFEEEANEPYTFHLDRLSFHFDRHHFARLHDLILFINKEPE